MRALLLKDWYMARKYCDSYLFIVLVFLVLSFVSDNVVFYTYPCMMTGLLPYTLYSYDEREKFTSYCAAMPVSKRQYVSGKYVFGLIASAAAALLTLICIIIKGKTSELMPMLGAAAIAALISQAAMLPFGFKFGVEKGRILFIAVVAVLFAAFYIVMGSGDSAPTLSGEALGYISLAVSALLFAASWLLSQRIYENKEF